MFGDSARVAANGGKHWNAYARRRRHINIVVSGPMIGDNTELLGGIYDIGIDITMPDDHAVDPIVTGQVEDAPLVDAIFTKDQVQSGIADGLCTGRSKGVASDQYRFGGATVFGCRNNRNLLSVGN